MNDVKPGGVFLLNSQWSDGELADKLPAEAKRYIAENDVRFYSIDAIDLARQIGMGKRTNTILQSAFFALSGVMPTEKATEYMKAAAARSYINKGQDVVDMTMNSVSSNLPTTFS